MIRTSSMLLMGTLSLALPRQNTLQTPGGQGGGRTPVAPTAGAAQPIRAGGGVPSGTMILGESPGAPAGYTSTGWSVLASGGPLSWAGRPSMPSARAELCVAACDGKLYAFGGGAGCNSSSAMEIYDPSTAMWMTATFPSARKTAAAAVVGSKIYVFGGSVVVACSFGPALGTTEVFDCSTSSWATLAPMPTARSAPAAAAAGGKIYVLGGSANPDVKQSVNEEYDPSTNTWSARASMGIARTNLAAVAANGRIYAIGGANQVNTPLADVEEYDPSRNVWTTVAPLPFPRAQPAAAAVNGKIYVIGGADSTWTQTNTVFEYDPVSNAWTTLDAMPTARYACAADAIDGRIYVCGGVPITSVLEALDTGVRSLHVYRKD